MPFDAFRAWQAAFLDVVQNTVTAGPLKQASLDENLGQWTGLLTAAVVGSCHALGWRAAGKGHKLDLLPQPGQEYLGIDVMGFPAPDGKPDIPNRWPLPIAGFELENSRQDDRIAYSLWKLLCLRLPLRVAFAYRPDWPKSRALIGALERELTGTLAPEDRKSIAGQTVVVVGNRGEDETFPWGYFKFWLLDHKLGRFEKVG